MPRDWDEQLRAQGFSNLIVPENDIVPLDNVVGWMPHNERFGYGPGQEMPRPDPDCPHCLGAPLKPLMTSLVDGVTETERSRLYCRRCGATGFERVLREQRFLSPRVLPERKPKPMPAKNKHVGKQKRKRGRPRRAA